MNIPRLLSLRYIYQQINIRSDEYGPIANSYLAVDKIGLWSLDDSCVNDNLGSKLFVVWIHFDEFDCKAGTVLPLL